MKKSPFAVTALFVLVLSLGGCVWAGPGYGYHDHGGDHGGDSGWSHGGGGNNGHWH